MNPHPTEDPRGHSYRSGGAAEPRVSFVPPERWRDSSDYLFGCDLYNHGYWWEAHEAWEALWRACGRESVQGKFLQGLIQTSACHLKRYTDRRRGVDRLRRTSRAYLSAVVAGIDGPVYMGLDLPAFLDAADRYYERTGGGEAPGHLPECYPYIVLGGPS